MYIILFLFIAYLAITFVPILINDLVIFFDCYIEDRKWRKDFEKELKKLTDQLGGSGE